MVLLWLSVDDGRISNPRGGACDDGTSIKLCGETTAAATDADQSMHIVMREGLGGG